MTIDYDGALRRAVRHAESAERTALSIDREHSSDREVERLVAVAQARCAAAFAWASVAEALAAGGRRA